MVYIRNFRKVLKSGLFRDLSIISKAFSYHSLHLNEALAVKVVETEYEPETKKTSNSSEAFYILPSDPDGLTYDFSTIDKKYSPTIENEVFVRSLSGRMWYWNSKKQYHKTIDFFQAYWTPLKENFVVFNNKGENIEMVNLALSAYQAIGKVETGFMIFQSLPQKHLLANQNTVKIGLNFCLKTRKWKFANSVFDSLDSIYNIKPCSVIVSIYCSILIRQGLFSKAFNLFYSSIKNSSSPSIVSYHIFIKELCLVGKLQEALVIYKKFRSKGFLPTEEIIIDIIKGFFKTNKPLQAHLLFQNLISKEKVISPSAKVFTVLITGFVRELESDLAFRYVMLMKKHGFTKRKYSEVLWDNLFNIAFNRRAPFRSEVALNLIEYLKSNFELPEKTNKFELNVAITKVFSSDFISTEISIDQNRLSKLELRNIKLFLNLINSITCPKDKIECFDILAQRLCQLGGLKYMHFFLRYMEHNNIQLNVLLYSVFITTSLDFKNIEFAKHLWRKLLSDQIPLNHVLFSGMISGLCRSTNPKLALRLYYIMRTNNYPPIFYITLKVFYLAQRLREKEFITWLLQDSLLLNSETGLTSQEQNIFLSKINIATNPN